MTHGTLRRLSPEEWAGLLETSPQRTRFLDPAFLELFDVPVRYWGIDRNGVIIAGMAVIDAGRFGARLLPWCYYQGIVLHREVWRAAPAKRTQYEIELAEELLTGAAREEPSISLSLHPSLGDVRGLDWVHYHDPEKARVRLLPRYTAVASLEGSTPESLRASSRSARRQEEGYAIGRDGLEADRSGTARELAALYAQTFARQGTDPPLDELDLLSKYVDYFLASGAGKVLTVRDKTGNAQAAALVFTDYDGTVHVPLVGTGETRFGGTLLYFHILDTALTTGARRVDFNGANSPRRAYFKHSIGARPVLYFEADYRASEAAP